MAIARTLGVVALLAAAACGGAHRNLAAYRADTNQLLASREPQIKACYDDALKVDGKLAGTVTVQFIVEKKTGAITNAAIAKDRTTAPPLLGDCVLKAMDGLVLAPGDRNEGRATFVYEFKPTTPPAAAPPAA